MGRRFYHAKDGNHEAIVDGIKARGQLFLDTSQTDLGFDGLVVVEGRLVPVEIKDPSSSRGLRLSPKEAKTHATLQAHGIRVEILTCVTDLDVLGRCQRNTYEER